MEKGNGKETNMWGNSRKGKNMAGGNILILMETSMKENTRMV